MTGPQGAPSTVSGWIPEARLDAPARVEPLPKSTPGPQRPTPDRPARPSRGRRPIILAAVVGLAVIAGAAIGVVAVGGGEAQPESAGGGGVEASPLTGPQTSASIPALAQQGRVPVVDRLTSLGASEASLLAAVAELRDERVAARAAGVESPAATTLSRVPYASSVRYQYLRRVGAVAVLLDGLDELDVRAARAGTTDRATSRVRTQVDRLSLVIARLNLSSYQPAQRLSDLVTAAILRLGPLAAGDLSPRSSAQLRRLNARLGALGRAIRADLGRAATAATLGDGRSARRLLGRVDRNLTKIAAA